MALTPQEQKNLAKIEKDLADMQKKRDELKTKSAATFSKLSIDLGLWKLDKKTIQEELKAIADKHKVA